MTKAQLMKKIAYLESINDFLKSELEYVDILMRKVGFAGGISTVKVTAEEIVQHGITLDDVGEL